MYLMQPSVHEIDVVQFGVSSPSEIKARSCCLVNNPKKNGPGSVYDPRMGVIDESMCETCGEKHKSCPGHFGHIELAEPFVNPVYERHIVNMLRCMCMSCCRLKLTLDSLEHRGVMVLRGVSRFKKIMVETKTMRVCGHEDCGAQTPEIKYVQQDGSIFKVFVEKKGTGKVERPVPLFASEILRTFDNITDDEVRLMGFDPSIAHPRNFIFLYLPVMPPCARPYVNKDLTICDDDITSQYVDIIKANIKLQTTLDMGDKNAQEDAYDKVKELIQSTFNNNKKKVKRAVNNSRPIRCIRSRIVGKKGIVRGALMGKRGDMSGRTVIGPDPTLKVHQVSMPRSMAETFTVPERVTYFNRAKLQDLADSGRVDFLLSPDGVTRTNLKSFRRGTILVPGDVIHRSVDGKDVQIAVTTGRELVEKGDRVMRKGKWVENLRHCNQSWKLEEGWIVERKLQNGDWCLMNRQPTLHRGSMMAHQLVIRDQLRGGIPEQHTMQISLAVTSSYNADFDGDEMNCHIPQSLEARIELSELAASNRQLISGQASKANLTIVQDALVGAYKMTYGLQSIEKQYFFDICMWTSLDCGQIQKKIQRIRHVRRDMGLKAKCYNGHGLISLALPDDFNYSLTNDVNPDEPTVKIHRGVMYAGTLSKSVLGSSHHGLIVTINKEYGPDRASQFIDEIQFIANQWLLRKGFSIGLRDCILEESSSTDALTKRQEIKGYMQKHYMKAEALKSTTSDPGILEARINAELGNARNIGMRIAKKALALDNGFVTTVTSGAKGDFFNIAQIAGALGQQNRRGSRIKKTMNHGRRATPHFPLGMELPPETDFLQQGFIENCFLDGLSPIEFYMHAIVSREGVANTATSTADSGYLQRKIVKVTEDMAVRYDGTVRDTTGRIFQFNYGRENLDPVHTVKVNGQQHAVDVKRLAERMNVQYETKLNRMKN